MAKFKFELNSAGVVELLKSAEMKEVLKEYGGKISSSAGNGYAYEEVMSGDRAKVFVGAETPEAQKDNSENNTLLKAIGGGK